MTNTFASFQEFIDNVLSLSYFEVMTDIHGGLAMLAMILFGGVIVLLLALDKFAQAYTWLKYSIIVLTADILILNSFGLYVYRPYRAPVPDSPRSLLKASESTSWLHTIVFEHKEFLAFAPMAIMMVATIIVLKEGEKLKKNPLMRKALMFAVVTSLIYILVVATEAVLVTKAQPLR